MAIRAYLPFNPRFPIHFHDSRSTSFDSTSNSHVIVPKEMLSFVPAFYKNRLLEENEWRSLGIQMSVGWWVYFLEGSPHSG